MSMNNTAGLVNEAALIDYGDALARVMGDEGFLEELLGLFCEDFPERIAQISNAILMKDSVKVRDISHSLKGAAANLSLGPIREASFSLEKAGGENRLGDAARILVKLEEEFLRLEDYRHIRALRHPKAAAPGKETDFSMTTGESPRILAVEDTRESGLILEMMARQEGIPLDVVQTGRDALRRIESNAYVLVLLDLNLPDLNGFEVLKEIRKIEKTQGRPGIPVIALTASSFPEDIKKCQAAGFARYLEKPVRKDILLSVLHEVLGGNAGLVAPSGFRFQDESIADLVPQYLENRRKDLRRMKTSLEKNDLETVESIAHQIKGSGASFGFIRIGEICQKMETAIRKRDRMTLEFWLRDLEGYLISAGPS